MKKYIFLVAAVLAYMPITAQETYENTKLVDNDLNGTARYMGMGGAMDALGADLSTINTNPAGIGLFRSSAASISFGIVSQSGAEKFNNSSPTKVSFDQVGFVYAMRSGRKSFLNFAFNYHKSKNFDYILSAAGSLDGSSQNRLSFIKAIGANDANGVSSFNLEDQDGTLYGTQPYTNQVDNLYYNYFNVDQNGNVGYNNANGYMMDRASTGYIGEYDFNISGNINDRVYLGATFGLHDVHYKGFSAYTESLVDAGNNPAGFTTIQDERRISGTGFDMKLGAIFRPIANSPFRIGVYVQTPTWYDLTTENYTTFANGTDYQGYNGNAGESSAAYDFKVYTPWKFGINLGHTIGNYLALGASYEYADYGSMDTRVNDGGSYDWYYDTYYESSYSDGNMNYHTQNTLKGVSTLKLGAEFKPVKDFAIRVGYNYVSPMFDKDGYKDGSIDSYGSNYSSATDYTNWGATNRFTVGLGYNINKFSIDLAYVYSATNGDFYPFMGGWGDYNYLDSTTGLLITDEIDNYADAVKVSDKRSQFVLTLGYRF